MLIRVKQVLSSAFTLIELLIVLLIAFILAIIAVPGFRHFIIQSRVTTVLNRLNGAIHYARNEAVTQNTVVALCGSREGRRCENDWSAGVLVERVLDHEALRFYSFSGYPLRVLWRSSFAKNDHLAFLGNGFTQGQQGSFYVCPVTSSAKAGQSLVVSASGRVRVSTDIQKTRAICADLS